ncbi:MAG TPA: haloacid dehalogenase-like hydrolase [Candidatus Sulfotelmatobacter sp.]|nr:haloacid dehalogenase-like hydrolase [Candidatus Sulfotelmatobacter sp.]
MKLVWLFDIDGTLLMTEGAAREAFERAVAERFPGPDPLGDVPFAGRVEPLILRDILARHGARFDLEDEARFWNSVFSHMRVALRPDRGTLLPGVAALLDAVDRETDWVSALLTGNMTQMARIKLAHFGLGGRFAFGAFGEEAADRDALARVAVARAARRYGVTPARCVVVGDTEHDVACARAAGAWAVAVATGGRAREALAATRPDLLLDDLSDPRALLEWARALEGSGLSARSRPASVEPLP